MTRRAWKRLTSATARGWLLVGTLLGVGVLPCPECGAPMIFHFWPVALLVAVVQVLKKRYRACATGDESSSEARDVDREI